MFDIIICEDNQAQRTMVENYINESIVQNNYDAQINISTNSPEKVIEFIEKNVNVNIYFIDMDLNSNITGIDIGKSIRKKDSKSYIIFITGHYELCIRTFEYNLRAFDYIVKGDNARIKDKLSECLSLIMEENEAKDKSKATYFMAKVGTKYYKIPYENIMFFETISGGHKILIHTSDGFIEFYAKIKDVVNEINSDFYQCHKSYIVNIKNIKEINKEELFIEMKNNEKCYFSKRHAKGILDKCLKL